MPFSRHMEGTKSIFVYKFAHRNTLCNLSHLTSILYYSSDHWARGLSWGGWGGKEPTLLWEIRKSAKANESLNTQNLTYSFGEFTIFLETHSCFLFIHSLNIHFIMSYWALAGSSELEATRLWTRFRQAFQLGMVHRFSCPLLRFIEKSSKIWPTVEEKEFKWDLKLLPLSGFIT